jgi:hypothetical protein
MWIYGALSQNQQSFATKVKFRPDCGSCAPRVWGQVNQLPKTIEWLLESPQNMSGDLGATAFWFTQESKTARGQPQRRGGV